MKREHTWPLLMALSGIGEDVFGKHARYNAFVALNQELAALWSSGGISRTNSINAIVSSSTRGPLPSPGSQATGRPIAIQQNTVNNQSTARRHIPPSATVHHAHHQPQAPPLHDLTSQMASMYMYAENQLQSRLPYIRFTMPAMPR